MRKGNAADDTLAALLDATSGAALVLDRELRVLAASASAVALLGGAPARGARAPDVLCGSRLDRPVAEALARGEPVTAVVPHPGRSDATRLRVRATPLGPKGRDGFVLALEPVVGATPTDDALVDFDGFLTADPATQEVLRIVARVARTDATVLVRGETGAGKDLIARALHRRSSRASGPFRALNCAALPPTLLESELFGHARGAFTGAIRDTPGHVVLADGGTLFLDEVGELPLELQAKLLRVLETRTVIPVGAREPVPVDVRFVSATHRSLRDEVNAGRFRADLLYRLRVVPVHLPPLRARRADLEPLLGRFLDEANRKGGRVIEHVAPAALAALARHPFPGNVRELRNVVEYAYAVGEGDTLVIHDLPPEIVHPEASSDLAAPEARRVSADDPEAQRLLAALERAGGRKARAAKILGMSRVTLWRKLREHGLSPS